MIMMTVTLIMTSLILIHSQKSNQEQVTPQAQDFGCTFLVVSTIENDM